MVALLLVLCRHHACAPLCITSRVASVSSYAAEAARKPFLHSRAGKVSMAAIILAIIVAATILILLFQPGLRYKLSNIPEQPLESGEYARLLEVLADAKLQQNSSIDVIANGEHFYPAELEAIRSAQKNINMEIYIFERGELTKQYVDALTERARAGVKVRLTIDAMGSFSMSKQYFQSLTEAGGHVEWYHPIRWYSWPRI